MELKKRARPTSTWQKKRINSELTYMKHLRTSHNEQLKVFSLFFKSANHYHTTLSTRVGNELLL